MLDDALPPEGDQVDDFVRFTMERLPSMDAQTAGAVECSLRELFGSSYWVKRNATASANKKDGRKGKRARHMTGPPLEFQPHFVPLGMDETERFLLRVFLRRYVTWCARQRRFAAMQGAARLSRTASAIPARRPL